MDDRDDDRQDRGDGPPRGWRGGQRGMGMGGHFGGPPQEMFDACVGKKAGDECSVKKADWELKAKCNVMPMGAEGRLACMPPHQPPGAAPAAAEPAKPAAPAAKPKK